MSNEEKIGSMCIILHRERSFQNIDIRILKSAIQKYARRAQLSKGVWCLIELDLFSIFERKPNLYPTKQLTEKQIRLNSVRIRSNMINRLIAMMSEDVGPTNSHLPSRIHRLYLQWIENRRDDSSRKILIEIYHCLANEKIKRIRLLSDLRTVFNLPEYLTEKINLHRKLLEKFQMNEIRKILYEKEDGIRTKQQIYEKIVEHLSKKCELAFAYLSILFQRNDQTIITQQLWPHLLRQTPFPESTQALAFFYKTLKHKEHYLYLYHAMAFIVYEDKIRKLDQQSNDSIDIDVEKLYQDHLNEENTIELDSFVFDRHTGVATSRSDFALEGARVANECQDLFNEKYRQMYNEFKVLIDNEEENKKRKRKTNQIDHHDDNQQTSSTTTKKPKLNTNEQTIDNEITRLGYQLEIQPNSFVTDYLSKLIHGQRRTGAHKKAVFISSEDVYKGPYFSNISGDVKRIQNNLYFTRALLILEEYLQIPSDYRTVIDWTAIIKIDETNEYYFKQKFLGNLSNCEDDYELVQTKVETDVRVFRRGSHIHRLIELEKDRTHFGDHQDQICQAAIQHFYLRYLLNIGDSGTWNILVRRDQNNSICGIDFEEIRAEKSSKTKDPLTLIMSKVSKQQRQIYQSFTEKIIRFQKKIDLNDPLALTLANSFQINVENMNQRIELYENCL